MKTPDAVRFPARGTGSTPPAVVGRGLARWQSLAIGVAIVVGLTVWAAGVMAIDVLTQGAADGAVLLAWLTAGAGYGVAVMRLGRMLVGAASALPINNRSMLAGDAGVAPAANAARRAADVLSDEANGLWALTAVALGLGLTSLFTLGLGLAGALSFATAWSVLVVGIAAAVYFVRHRSVRQIMPWLMVRSAAASVTWLLAIPLAVAFLAASVPPGWLWKPFDPHPYDVVSYHLQIPREWFDAGRIIPLRHNSFSFFPMGMEMHFLNGMHLTGGPWKGMYLCQLMSLAHGALTVLGVITVCRWMGVGPVLSRVAGLLTACVPWVLMLSSVAYVEPGVMLYTLLATAWAMRALGASGHPNLRQPDAAAQAVDSSNSGQNPRLAPRRPVAATVFPMAIAGAMAGFACGMKYTAFAMTAVPLLVLWPHVAMRAAGLRRVILPTIVAGVVCVAVVSPWLVRNIAWSGNPVFPLATGVFGRGHFTHDEIDRYRLAHWPPEPERSLRARLNSAAVHVVGDAEYGFVPLPAAVVGGFFIRRSAVRNFIVLILLAMAGVWLLATHDLPRFLTPAIPLAGVLVGLATRRGRAVQWAGGAVMIASAVFGLGWTWSVLAPTLALGQQGLFRLSDMTILESEEVKAARLSGDRVALIGDAQAFLYVIPSDRLLYRGVFDVNIPPDTNLVDGWLGESVDSLRRKGFWVVINTSELDRLSRTYAHLPRPTPPYDVVSPTPTVLPPLRP